MRTTSYSTLDSYRNFSFSSLNNNKNINININNNKKNKNNKNKNIDNDNNDDNNDNNDNSDNDSDTDNDSIYSTLTIFNNIKLVKFNIDTIENVYQLNYNNNVSCSGMGDFIRGSYYLMQFCREYNISYNINFYNHPVSHFLDNYKNKQTFIENTINKFNNNNYNPFLLKNNIITNIYDTGINDKLFHFLSKQQSSNKVVYLYCTSYPTTKIDNDHKYFMKQIIKPTDELSILVDKKILNLKLTKYNFIVIHIRFGDNYLVNKNTNIEWNKLNIITTKLKKVSPSKDYLLISDNNIIKKYIISQYPFIKTHFSEITHTAQGDNTDIIKLENTMIDFYLISYATKIMAFSVYMHGTGFSQWCAETYDIPYSCQFLG
jgi:hypothetical protein